MDRALQETFEAAFKCHQAGRLAEAEARYRKLLRRAPRNADALHLLGLLRHQQGHSADAESLIAQALKVRPDAVYYENLATIQRSRGALAAVIETCRAGLGRVSSAHLRSMLLDALIEVGDFRQALDLLDQLEPTEPASAGRLADRALCLFRIGRPAEAEAAAERALAIDPGNGNALSVLADLASARGDHRRAVALWRQAVSERPDWVAARINLGISYIRFGDASAAAELLASTSIPEDAGLAASLLNSRAAALRKLGQEEPARRCLQAALALSPGSAEYLGNLSELWRRSDAAYALRLAGRSLASDPHGTGGYTNHGLALEEVERIVEAVASLRRAIALSPSDPEVLNNIGSPLRWLGHFQETHDVYRRVVAVDPTFAPGWYGLGTVQLLTGDLDRGWIGYHWRIRGEHITKPRPFRMPFWRGPSETGGTLLVWGEQGLGDEIVYGSMLPELEKSGVRALVECDARIIGPFSRALPALEFVARRDPPDPRLTADDVVAQMPMGSLANWYRARIEDFPAVGGYLKPRPDLVEHWRRRLAELGEGPKIGFAWRSSRTDGVARRFHPPVLEWAPVLTRPGARFISLQYGESEDDIERVRSALGASVHKFPDLDLRDDLEGILALSVALDLVISTGTTAFCLPAAAGVPLWLLTPESDFWILGTGRYPWFPNIRVYAHGYRLPWSSTIGRIGDDLAARLQGAPAIRLL